MNQPHKPPASLENVDPNAASRPGSGLYGLEVAREDAAVWVLPVPFDATTSYRPGTFEGPAAVARASHQVDLLCPLFGHPWRAGIVLCDEPEGVRAAQAEAFDRAREIVAVGGWIDGDPRLIADLAAVEAASARMNAAVRSATEEALDAGKLPVVLGGDHSTPFGAIAAVVERHPGVGVLQFDAHSDLRRAFEGFRWSHASILRNVMDELDGVGKLVQVGIRDTCPEEVDYAADSGGRIEILGDEAWAEARLGRTDLAGLARQWIARLPREVYVTFDVDALDPGLCPNTGTPVPGGLRWDEVSLWLRALASSGRRVVGLDLVEVSPGGATDPDALDSWDANVGARLLYRLIGCALRTRGET